MLPFWKFLFGGGGGGGDLFVPRHVGFRFSFCLSVYVRVFFLFSFRSHGSPPPGLPIMFEVEMGLKGGLFGRPLAFGALGFYNAYLLMAWVLCQW